MGSMFGGFGSSQNRLMDYAEDGMQQPGSFSGVGTGGVNQGTYRPADLNPGTFSGVGNGLQPQAPIAQRPYQLGNVAPVAQRQPPTQSYQPPIAQRQSYLAQGQPSVVQGMYRPQPQAPIAQRPYQGADRASLFQGMFQRLWGN